MGKSRRPRIDIPRSPADMVLQLVAFVGLVLVFFFTVQSWNDLPDTIPTHFNAAGQANSWGSKGTLWTLPVVTAVMYLMLTALEFFPHTYNYPLKITPQNAERQYYLARSLLVWMKAELAVMLAYLQWEWIQSALGKSEGLGILFLPVILIALFSTIGVYFWQAFQARV